MVKIYKNSKIAAIKINAGLYLPAMVAFCQGRKKITRPSDVEGSNKPMLAGL